MTRRDLVVALIAVGLTSGAFVVAGEAPLLAPAAFEWNSIPAKPTDYGSVRSFFKSRTATLDQLEVHVTALDPGKSTHPPVRQASEELIIVKEGVVEAMVGSEWKRVGAGSIVFNALNELHGLRNPGTQPAAYYVISWRTPATPHP